MRVRVRVRVRARVHVACIACVLCVRVLRVRVLCVRVLRLRAFGLLVYYLSASLGECSRGNERQAVFTNRLEGLKASQAAGTSCTGVGEASPLG